MNSHSPADPVRDPSPCPCGSGRAYLVCCGAPLLRPSEQQRRDPRLLEALKTAQADLQAGRTEQAEATVRRLLVDLPGHLGALSLLARLRKHAGDDAAVGVLLQRMAALYPENDAVLFDQSTWLAEHGRSREAETPLRTLLDRNPRHAAAHGLLGQLVIQNLGTLEKAEYHLRQAYYLQPSVATHSVRLARVLRLLGRWEEAVHFLRIALALEPNNLDALLGWVRIEESRHNLARAWVMQRIASAAAPDNAHNVLSEALLHRRGNAYDDALATLGRIVPDQLPANMQAGYYFERGRILEGMGRYPEAFAAFDQANRSARRNPRLRYDAPRNARALAELKDFFTRARLRNLPRGRPQRPDEERPVFIVGFPRSGTSMVEQILSAHPDISAGNELILAQRLTEHAGPWLNDRRPFPYCLEALARPEHRDTLQRFRDYYLGEIRTIAILDPGVRRFTDKMPLNEVHLGILSMVFPEAHIVHLIRHPLDVLTSCYCNELRHGDNFAFDLDTAARHYVLVMDLVEHYRRELDMNYLALRYEDLVGDIEGGVRRLLEFLGVPWEPRCVEFHQNERNARTASYAQVTEKVYSRSVFRYRHYREQLEAIVPVIAPVAERLGYTLD
jgi:tetratricopeptide (TPR) repeat protein